MAKNPQARIDKSSVDYLIGQIDALQKAQSDRLDAVDATLADLKRQITDNRVSLAKIVGWAGGVSASISASISAAIKYLPGGGHQ